MPAMIAPLISRARWRIVLASGARWSQPTSNHPSSSTSAARSARSPSPSSSASCASGGLQIGTTRKPPLSKTNSRGCRPYTSAYGRTACTVFLSRSKRTRFCPSEGLEALRAGDAPRPWRRALLDTGGGPSWRTRLQASATPHLWPTARLAVGASPHGVNEADTPPPTPPSGLPPPRTSSAQTRLPLRSAHPMHAIRLIPPWYMDRRPMDDVCCRHLRQP
mmetsp:Transcript_45590/g.120486  ORF Transcript_45590/g.120486 Transcript_45590/m.120486 type:complete len:220 (-) Transcript_45590:58-717(-)